MIPGVAYDLPPELMDNPSVAEGEQLITEFFSAPRQQLEVAIHESGHKLQFDRHGVRTTYEGPAIDFAPIRRPDSPELVWGLSVSFGGVVPDMDESYNQLTAEQLARCAVAGRISEIVILGSAPPETSERDFLDFIYCSKGTPSELILLWKKTEQAMLEELRNDLGLQKEIVHEAEKFQRQILPDCIHSVKKSNPHGCLAN